jgi:hypothetical protein
LMAFSCNCPGALSIKYLSSISCINYSDERYNLQFKFKLVYQKPTLIILIFLLPFFSSNLQFV